jgi:hypothetical protein
LSEPRPIGATNINRVGEVDCPNSLSGISVGFLHALDFKTARDILHVEKDFTTGTSNEERNLSLFDPSIFLCIQVRNV